MKNSIHYLNLSTGEVTNDHALAMIWYNELNEIALIDWSESLQEWIERGRWVW